MSRRARRLFRALLSWRMLGPVIRPVFRAPQRHPWRVEGRTVFVGDREFMVRQAGPEEGAQVVLAHGLGGSSLAEWYEVASRLAERYRVTLVDHRSHGLSPRETERFDVDDLADDLAGVMARIGVPRATVVGYSMGGTIAQSLAHRHPHRVERMVLIGTFTHHPPAWRAARRIGVWLTRAFERVTGVGTPEVRAGYLILTGAVAPPHARWMWEETHRRDPEAGAAAGFALLRFDSREWVGRLDVPALVVIATRDQMVPPKWQYGLAAALRRAEVLEIPDARHEVPWTHPDEIAKGIFEFVG